MTNSGADDMLRHATVSWLTDPPHGHARVRVDSGAFAALPLSIPGGEPTDGETTPGELLAAAYSAFMATNLAQRLQRDGKPASELVVDVRCRLSPEVTARSVEGIDVEVRARVTRLDRERLRIAAAEALAISREALGLSAGVRTDLRVSLLRTVRS